MFKPSKYQEEIFKWFRNPRGPIVISAVAGSGKTTTLVNGMKEGQATGNRMFAAFNTSIVKELKSRLPESVNCQTLHSLGLATLRRNFSAVKKWDVENGNTKYRAMARDLKLPDEDWRLLVDRSAIQDCVLSLLNYAQMTLAPIEEKSLLALADRFGVEIPSEVPIEWITETVGEMLDTGAALAQKGLISYSDMIYMPAALGLRPQSYSMIAVDEAQDLNKSQMALLTSALAHNGNFIAVGDRQQAIYMFAGAESDSFDQLKKHFGAEELPLNYCYRCPEKVINLAKTIVPQIEAPEGTRPGVVDEVTNDKFQSMLRPGDMVLCRLTAPLVKLCFQLIGKRINATVRGRDIGQQIANTVMTIMKRNTNISEFPARMYAWQESQLNLLRAKLGSENQQESVNDRVDCLSIMFATFKPYSVQDFCQKIRNLFSDESGSPITLCTVHRAKGLENDRVFIIKPECLPLVRKNQTPAQFEQEMNLKYVAITRAKEELYSVLSPPEDVATRTNPGLPGITK